MEDNSRIISGNIFTNMLIFTFPIIITGILQLLYNAADVIVVGRYAGSNSLAAVGSTGSLVTLFTNLFVGLSSGTSVCVAQFTGAKNSEAIKKSVHTSIGISLIGGLFLTFIGLIFSKDMLELMSTPDDILNEAALYMRIIFLGMPASMLFNFGAAILRAAGDTKTPMIFLSASGIINVILNLVFVIVFKMNASGVGTATIISQIISAALIVTHLMKLDTDCKLRLKEIGIDKKILIKILKIGLPAGFQGTIFSISNVQIQSAINGFGSQAVAGNSAAVNLEGFTYIAMNSFHHSILTFVGQNVGAKKTERLKKIIFTGCAQVTMVGLILGFICLIFGAPLLNLYTPGDSEVINYGLKRISIILPTYFLCGVMDVVVGALRGMGVSLLPMIVTIVGVCGVRMFWIYTVFAHFKTLSCLYISYPASWLLTTVIHTVCCIFAARKIIAQSIRQN
ncbi:MAG: MATE family efflux transporter [Clostridia bacterium]|nr:MATE family efflux transporter [Clostridia bacterium]